MEAKVFYCSDALLWCTSSPCFPCPIESFLKRCSSVHHSLPMDFPCSVAVKNVNKLKFNLNLFGIVTVFKFSFLFSFFKRYFWWRRCNLYTFSFSFYLRTQTRKRKKQKQFQREIRKQVFYHWESGRIYHRWVGFGVISVVILYGVRWHLCNSTLSDTSDITLDPHVALLSPRRVPRVLHYPIIDTSHCAVSNNSNNVGWCCSTWSGEYALRRKFETKED